MLSVTLSDWKGRRIEGSLRDHDRNKSLLNQQENLDYIVIGLRFTVEGMVTIKRRSNIYKFAGDFQCVRLTYGWHSGGAGNKTVTIGPKRGDRGAGNRVLIERSDVQRSAPDLPA